MNNFPYNPNQQGFNQNPPPVRTYDMEGSGLLGATAQVPPQFQQQPVAPGLNSQQAAVENRPQFIQAEYNPQQQPVAYQAPAMNDFLASFGGAITPQEQQNIEQLRREQEELQAELEKEKAAARTAPTGAQIQKASDLANVFSNIPGTGFEPPQDPLKNIIGGYQVPQAAEQKKPEAPKAEEPVENKFSMKDKQEIATAMIKKNPDYRKTYLLNQLVSVTVKLLSEKEQHLLNQQVHAARTTGDKRRYYTKVTGFDEKDRPVNSETEYDDFVNYDADRSIRQAQIAAHVIMIGGDILPEKIDARKEALEDYSSAFLDIIYNEAVIPFIGLCREAKRDFKNF